ncbi:MAG: RiPP maturation radical SAM C-methyltransferase [Deltaproteobacteria bacterium]|jgi:ribosomal peptide maturation radical SAM protein 1|nr:RiPP maturation radical SAM C-methyltransferase [Deltaproteobacteria bacterium]
MKSKPKKTLSQIALISTPWPLFNRPSVQLGTLKAYLKTRMPDLQVDIFHFYLQLAEAIGYHLYHEISERTWLAESVYAALLYPRSRQLAQRLFRKESAGKARMQKIDFKALIRKIKKATDRLVHSHDWQTYGLIGFSISLCQLTSALYIIKRLKQACPKVTIVVGGALTPAIAAPALLKNFADIDMVVNGEGELPLYHIIQDLERSSSGPGRSSIEGVFTRQTDAMQPAAAAFAQLKRLDDLPVPDYDAYFSLLKTFEPHKRFFPTLPVEASRGCWWKRSVGPDQLTGCAFCNLNLQWEGYRSKTARRIVADIDYLTGRHQTLSVALMDNVLPPKDAHTLFQQVAKLNKDLRLFGEVRATTSLKALIAMRDCGMREVQIGIEALSSSLLKKLHKGTTAIQNLEIMRNCEALGIRNISNLILHFPGSDQDDVTETLRTLEFARPFYPLKAVRFWLGLESPVWRNPKAYGIKAIFNHRNWSYLFPDNIFRSLPFLIQAYRGDLTYQKKIWKPVQKELSDWHQQYTEIHATQGYGPILSLRDGGDFSIIRQRRYQDEPAVHRLTGASRQIYLFCQQHRPIKAICTAFPHVPADDIAHFLKMMVDKKLMFSEKNQYVSLAAPVRQKRN